MPRAVRNRWLMAFWFAAQAPLKKRGLVILTNSVNFFTELVIFFTRHQLVTSLHPGMGGRPHFSQLCVLFVNTSLRLPSRAGGEEFHRLLFSRRLPASRRGAEPLSPRASGLFILHRPDWHEPCGS